MATEAHGNTRKKADSMFVHKTTYSPQGCRMRKELYQQINVAALRTVQIRSKANSL
jgi:hypothetical protein